MERMRISVRGLVVRIVLRALSSLLPVALLVAQPSQPFYFIQLTDPQLGYHPLHRGMQYELDHLEKAVVAVNRLRPAFVVITGDMVHRVGDTAQIKAFQAMLARIDSSIPYYLVAGNHDVGDRPTELTLAAYRKDFGPDHYTFMVHGVRFIVINSPLIKASQSAPRSANEQIEWLRGLISREPPRSGSPLTILFQHHPWFVDGQYETDSYWNMGGRDRRAYLPVLDSLGIQWVFSGHLHASVEASAGGINFITSGPVGMPHDLSGSGLRIVFVGPGGVAHQFYPLDDVPEQVTIPEEVIR